MTKKFIDRGAVEAPIDADVLRVPLPHPNLQFGSYHNQAVFEDIKGWVSWTPAKHQLSGCQMNSTRDSFTISILIGLKMKTWTNTGRIHHTIHLSTTRKHLLCPYPSSFHEATPQPFTDDCLNNAQYNKEKSLTCADKRAAAETSIHVMLHSLVNPSWGELSFGPTSNITTTV